MAKLAEARQKTVDIFEQTEMQSNSTDPSEAAKATGTCHCARLQQEKAQTPTKQVSLVENSLPTPASQSCALTNVATAQRPSLARPLPHRQWNASLHTLSPNPNLHPSPAQTYRNPQGNKEQGLRLRAINKPAIQTFGIGETSKNGTPIY